MMNFWREICIGLDTIIFGLLEGVFQLIIDLANIEIFSQSSINEFANRVYIILGLLMLFKITISFVQMLVNPDRMDDKEQGMGNILKRVIISLALIFLVPSIFDLARDLQNRVLPIIPKVILGVTVNPDTDEGVTDTMQSMGQTLSFYSFLPFFNYDNQTCDDGSILGTGTALSGSAVPEIYSISSASAHVNDTNSCSTDKRNYKYKYRWLISSFVGIYLIFALVGVAIQVAIRAIKFAICEVIAPIPIASYIDPKLSKQTFDNWVSTTISVYTDLFINLAVVYLIIYVASAVFQKDNLATIYSKLGGNPLRYTFVTLFIIIGLTHFVKQAPQFFTDLLGIKSGGNRIGDIFKGSAKVFGTAGAMGYAGYRGAVDSAKQSADGGEGKSLQRTRAGLGGASAAARTLVNNIRGKKTRESARTALDNVYSRNRKSIALTRNFADLDENGNVVSPGIGTLFEAHGRAHAEKVNVKHGGLTEKEILDSRVGNIRKFGTVVDEGRSSFSGHKLAKVYAEHYEAAKTSSVESYFDETRANLNNELQANYNEAGRIANELNRTDLTAEHRRELQDRVTQLTNRESAINRALTNNEALRQEAEGVRSAHINRAKRDADDIKKRLFRLSVAGDREHVADFLNQEDIALLQEAGLNSLEEVWDNGDYMERNRLKVQNASNELADAMQLDSGLRREVETMQTDLGINLVDQNGRVHYENLTLSQAGDLKERSGRVADTLETQRSSQQASAINTFNSDGGGKS